MRVDGAVIRSGVLALAIFFAAMAASQHVLMPSVGGLLGLVWPDWEASAVTLFGVATVEIGAFLDALLRIGLALALALGLVRLLRR